VSGGIRSILTGRAPAPGGHYAQGTVHAGLIHIAGQLPIRPDGVPLLDASFEDQARQALDNLLAVVEAGGGDAGTVLKINVYLVGVEHWPAFNAVFAARFGEARPARAVIPVPALHYDFLVEVDGIAAMRASV
jgi:2-iminobutanoate/2-iminopropanoate deaminase